MNISDVQSWWEIPCIAHFCSLFRLYFDLIDFDIEVSSSNAQSWLNRLELMYENLSQVN